MDEILEVASEELDDEGIARRLASDEGDVLLGLTLTPVQQLLHIPPAIVYLANIAMDGGFVISRDAANRFARLQLHYHSACQRLRPDQATTQLLRLSPSMITPPPELAAALDAADDDACRSAAAAEAARAARIASAEESARALVAEVEEERRRVSRRGKMRRKKPLDSAGARTANSPGELCRSGSGSDDADEVAAEDTRAASIVAGPTLDELRTAPSVRLEVFDPAEWTEVGGKATASVKAADVSMLALASEGAPKQLRATGDKANGSKGLDRPMMAEGSEGRASGARTAPDGAVSALLSAQQQQQQQQPQPQPQPQPQLVTGSPLLHGLSRLPSRSKQQQQSLLSQPRPRASPQPAQPPSEQPLSLPNASVTANSPAAQALEAACAAQLSAPGGAECARAIAASVQRYVSEILANERTAHEAALCKVLKEAHERADARAQSLRLRLYISETKCQELEAAVRELESGVQPAVPPSADAPSTDAP